MAEKTYWPTINQRLQDANRVIQERGTTMITRTGEQNTQFQTDFIALGAQISTFLLTYGAYKEQP